MQRYLMSVRHALVVAAGALIVFATHQGAPALLGLIPGYSGQMFEWTSLHQEWPALTAIILSTLIAVILSVVQEAPRTRGLRFSVLLGVLFGIAAFLSRVSSTPTHLIDVAGLVAALWAIGVIAAAAVMYELKKHETGQVRSVISNAG